MSFRRRKTPPPPVYDGSWFANLRSASIPDIPVIDAPLAKGRYTVRWWGEGQPFIMLLNDDQANGRACVRCGATDDGRLTVGVIDETLANAVICETPRWHGIDRTIP